MFVADDAGGTLWSTTATGGQGAETPRTPHSPSRFSSSSSSSPTKGSRGGGPTVTAHNKLTVATGTGIVGSCFSSKAVLCLDEERLREATGSLDSCLVPFQPRSLLCVPLLSQNPGSTHGSSSRPPAGCLVLLSATHTAFSHEAQRAAELCGTHIAAYMRTAQQITEGRANLSDAQQLLAAAQAEVASLRAALTSAREETEEVKRQLEIEREERLGQDKRRKSFHEWLESSGTGGGRRRSVFEPPAPAPAPVTAPEPLRVHIPPPPPMDAPLQRALSRIPPPPPPRSPTVTLSSPMRTRGRRPGGDDLPTARKLFAETATSPAFAWRGGGTHDIATSPSVVGHLHKRPVVADVPVEALSIGIQAAMSPVGVAVQTSPAQRKEALEAIRSVRSAGRSSRSHTHTQSQAQSRSHSHAPTHAGTHAGTQGAFDDIFSARIPFGQSRSLSPSRSPSRSGAPDSPTTRPHSSPATRLTSSPTTRLPSSPTSGLNVSRRGGRSRRASVEDVLALSSALQQGDVGEAGLFGKMMAQLRDLLGADRAVLYLVDAAHGQLYTKVSEGGNTLRVPLGKGIVGQAGATGETIVLAGPWLFVPLCVFLFAVSFVVVCVCLLPTLSLVIVCVCVCVWAGVVCVRAKHPCPLRVQCPPVCPCCPRLQTCTATPASTLMRMCCAAATRRA